MPRKRKKSSQQCRPSLVFTESPIHKQLNVPCPVLCAENPTTARSVPIDEIDELAWVSPQFRSITGSIDKRGRKRVTRQRRKSTTGISLTARNINKENTFHGPITRNCKFKSLKFIGDQTTVNSLAEDVDITCDTDTEGEGQLKDEGRISDLEQSSGDVSKRRRSLKTRAKRTSNTVRKTLRGSLESRDFDFVDNHAVHSEVCEIGNNVYENGAITSETEATSVTPKAYFQGCNQNSRISSNFVNTNSKTTDVDGPVKRLFASQFMNGNANNSKVSETDLSDTSMNSSDVGTVVETSDSDHNSAVRRSVRIQMLEKLFLDRQTPCKTPKSSKVLVTDTPQTECGMPLRKKQLRKLKKKLSRSRD